MNTRCSIALLESALAGSLPADDEAALNQHLEECEQCGAALERMAGGAAWCREAASLLARDELDAAVPGHPLAGRDEWSEVDFTVEHLEPTDEPNVLGRLGGYDVLEIIGRGGMGVVLKAFDRELKRCVAIKVLSPHLAQSSLAKKRFAREAQAAAAVVHPNVLAIHQVQPGGRLPFLVMPLVAGESLAGRLAAQGRLELKETLRIGMQAAAGLAAAHEQGLVHRDVKPANILLEKGVERAVLTDFGLARAADDVTLTRWGIIAGTPQYMSPEQARGEPLDGRSDLFSLGCVLYEMATGVSPFRTDSVMATMRRLVDDPPQAMQALNPELPPWFIAIVDRLLEKDPSRRFASAKEVSQLLEGCLAHLQQPGSVPLPADLPKPVPRRGWWPPNVFITLRRDGKALRGHRRTALVGVMSTVIASLARIRLKGVLAMIAALGVGLLGVLLLSAAPPDIAGQWSGEEWGQVVLKKTSDAEYTGTYTDTVGKQPGEIQLKWSRIERRFNGTWREGDDRFGELSVRLVGDEIRGALTTDPKSKINPATPRLADLTWTRAKPTVAENPGARSEATFGPVIERVVTNAIDLDTGTLAHWPERPEPPGGAVSHGGVGIDNLEEGISLMITWSEQHGMDAWYSDGDLFGLGLKLKPLSNEDWDKLTPVQLVASLASIASNGLPKVKLSAGKNPPATYAFQTREGGIGLLQTFGTTQDGNGVKIRYKLVQGGATNTAAARHLSFGPAIGRVLPNGALCTAQYFQFQKGEILMVCKGPGMTNEEWARDWKKAEDAGGVDFTALWSENGQVYLQGRGCIFSRGVASVVPGEESTAELNWDKTTAEDAVTSMKVASSDGSVEWPTRDLPITYLFKTARGETGIMQILGAVEDKRGDGGRGIKFRYKLVQGGAPKPAAAAEPTTPNSHPKAPLTRAVMATGSLDATTSGPATKWVCRAIVDEADIIAVEVGQEVRLTVDALPHRTFQGKVAEVGNTPVAAQNAVLYETRIDIAHPDPKFKVGMSANVWFSQAKPAASAAEQKQPPAKASATRQSKPSFDEARKFEEARNAALQIMQSRALWPQSPEALCKEFWAARARKDYAEMKVLWPGSASFDWETLRRQDDANVTYVFGAWDGRQVPYASAEYHRRHGSYNMKMLLGSIETAKGKRHFVISGN